MSDTTQYLVWWTSQVECELIGEELPEAVPMYIRKEYRSRFGRNGRGRLWVADEINSGDMAWDESKPAARLANERGGIVIRPEDASHVVALPGFLTDWQLDFVRALSPLVPALTEPTLAAIRELCNCVDVVAAAPFAMPELAGAYLDDVATVRAWLDSYRERTA